MNRSGWILVLAAMLFSMACGMEDQSTIDSGDSAFVLQENVRLLEQHPAFYSRDLEENRIVFEFTESVEDLDVAAGDIIVGAEYLRGVETVQKDGNLLIVETSLSVFIFDLFERAHFHGVIQPMDGPEVFGPYGQIQQPLDLTISIPFDGVKIELKVEEGSEAIGGSVEFMPGSYMRFGPTIVWEMDLETPPLYLFWNPSKYTLHDLRIGLRGQFDLNVDIKWEAARASTLGGSKKLFNWTDKDNVFQRGWFNRPQPEYPFFFQLGPIPVKSNIVFNINTYATLTATGEGKGQAGFETHAMMEPGVHYDGQNWEAYFEKNFEFDKHDPTASGPSASLKVTLKLGVVPEVMWEFYEIGGPVIKIDGYIKAELELLPDLCFVLGLYTDVFIGIEFSGKIAEIFGLTASRGETFKDVIKWELVQTCEEVGNLAGQIVIWNTDPDVPIEGATIDIYKEDGSKVEPTLTSAADGGYSKEALPVGQYRVHVEKQGYLPADVSVEVKAEQTVYVTELKALTDACDAPGTASGDVVDATNKQGISAHLDFRAGVDMRTGDIVASTDCAADGTYSVSGLDSGHYTAHAQLEGYADAYFNVIVCGIDDGDSENDETPDQRGMMSPLEPGNWRIMLSWGERPNDLDLHCLTPGGKHIFFRDAPGANCRGSRDVDPHVALDVDQTKGYGPETLTFTQFHAGTYSVFVHNYGAENDHEYVGGTYADESTPFSSSQAKIRIYNGQNEEVEAPGINVPSSGDGYFWHVLTIDGSSKEITIQNSVDSSGQNPHDFIEPLSCLE